MDKCYHCKKAIEGNTPFILKRISSIGYEELNFCSADCFISCLKKKGFIVRFISELKLNHLIKIFFRYIYLNSNLTEKEFIDYTKKEFLESYEKLKHEEIKK